MSYDVLDELRRWLVDLRTAPRARTTAPVDRRSNDPASAASDSHAAVLADGGDRHEADHADDHLRDLPDGAGCTEIWEHLSERQAEGDQADGGRTEGRRASECQADD